MGVRGERGGGGEKATRVSASVCVSVCVCVCECVCVEVRKDQLTITILEYNLSLQRTLSNTYIRNTMQIDS